MMYADSCCGQSRGSQWTWRRSQGNISWWIPRRTTNRVVLRSFSAKKKSAKFVRLPIFPKSPWKLSFRGDRNNLWAHSLESLSAWRSNNFREITNTPEMSRIKLSNSYFFAVHKILSFTQTKLRSLIKRCVQIVYFIDLLIRTLIKDSSSGLTSLL